MKPLHPLPDNHATRSGITRAPATNQSAAPFRYLKTSPYDYLEKTTTDKLLFENKEADDFEKDGLSLDSEEKRKTLKAIG